MLPEAEEAGKGSCCGGGVHGGGDLLCGAEQYNLLFLQALSQPPGRGRFCVMPSIWLKPSMFIERGRERKLHGLTCFSFPRHTATVPVDYSGAD